MQCGLAACAVREGSPEAEEHPHPRGGGVRGAQVL